MASWSLKARLTTHPNALLKINEHLFGVAASGAPDPEREHEHDDYREKSLNASQIQKVALGHKQFVSLHRI
jgi:hypothetical protein